MYNSRVIPHDSHQNYLINNNFTFFGSPVYPVDPELQNFRDLRREHLNRSEDENYMLYNAAYNSSPFLQQLLMQFGINMNYVLFLQKAGDFVVDIYGEWYLVDIKTTNYADGIFHLNFDAYLAYEDLPVEKRNKVYFLFCDDATQNYYVVNYNHLRIEPVCYVYPEVLPQRFEQIRNSNRFFSIEYNTNPNPIKGIDPTTNAYFKISLHDQLPGVVQPLQQCINQLKNQHQQSINSPQHMNQ
ncbi:hypothetical protein KP77_28590 [Jeotgalibacillus alimentarius]|uniref:Uncharacterized protein n=1 Tax=Jeotgalibacillus alimentarius TaxID=135826 RepID=A0A0C2V9E8_9BACL|nr:hypothetical protein [Jeotgalibacillus alimentarius]KIL45567.1 hypothetical protein KP77_28590 [Jeotgalibacillus alimentarius]